MLIELALTLLLTAQSAPDPAVRGDQCARLGDAFGTSWTDGITAERIEQERDFYICLNEIADMGRTAIGAAPALHHELDNPDRAVRNGVLRTLAHIGDRSVVPHAHQLLEAGDFTASLAALTALELLGSEADVEPLRRAAAGHWSAIVRQRAWQLSLSGALSDTREPGSGPAREEEMRVDPVFGMRIPRVPRDRDLYILRLSDWPYPSCPSETFRVASEVVSWRDRIPEGQPTPTTLRFADGSLRYTGRGEWGGELEWQPDDGPAEQIVSDNIAGATRMNATAVVAVAGLAHAGDEGRVLIVERHGDHWRVEDAASLPSAPLWATGLGDGRIGIRTARGFHVFNGRRMIGEGQCEPGPLAPPEFAR